jgi:hypothetical protein
MDRFKQGAGEDSPSRKVFIEDESEYDTGSLDAHARSNLTRLKGYKTREI